MCSHKRSEVADVGGRQGPGGGSGRDSLAGWDTCGARNRSAKPDGPGTTAVGSTALSDRDVDVECGYADGYRLGLSILTAVAAADGVPAVALRVADGG